MAARLVRTGRVETVKVMVEGVGRRVWRVWVGGDVRVARWARTMFRAYLGQSRGELMVWEESWQLYVLKGAREW